MNFSKHSLILLWFVFALGVTATIGFPASAQTLKLSVSGNAGWAPGGQTEYVVNSMEITIQNRGPLPWISSPYNALLNKPFILVIDSLGVDATLIPVYSDLPVRIQPNGVYTVKQNTNHKLGDYMMYGPSVGGPHYASCNAFLYCGPKKVAEGQGQVKCPDKVF